MSPHSYPHMCRDDHEEVGWRGDGEMCPVCIAKSSTTELYEALKALVSAANEPSLEMAEGEEYYQLRAAIRGADAALAKAEGKP